MIDQEKIRRMNAVALQKKKEKFHEEQIVRHRRKFYMELNLFIVWLMSSISYLILSALTAVCILSQFEEASCSSEYLKSERIIWAAGYLFFCIFFLSLAYAVYSRRYHLAKGWQIRFNRELRALEDYYHESASSDETDWL